MVHAGGRYYAQVFWQKPDTQLKAGNTIVTVADEDLVQAMKELEENVNKQG